MTEEYLEKIRELRQLLHHLPALSGQEGETIELLCSFLKKNTSLEIHRKDGWFYVVKKGTGVHQPMAFRADMDALPMDECLDLAYGSLKKGISHKCGHDGHMAALCGLALELDQKLVDRDLYLIFQPAEETGQGALQCKDLIKEKGIRLIYAFHNLGGFPEKGIVYHRGLTQPASEGLRIHFSGSPSHASAPEKGINPVEQPPVFAGSVKQNRARPPSFPSHRNGWTRSF